MNKLFFLCLALLLVVHPPKLWADETGALSQAEDLYLKNDYAGSLKIYQEILADHHKLAPAMLFNMGILAQLTGNKNLSLAYYAGAYLSDPAEVQIRTTFMNLLSSRTAISDDTFFSILGQLRFLWLIPIPIQFVVFSLASCVFWLFPFFPDKMKSAKLRLLTLLLTIIFGVSLGIYQYLIMKDWGVVQGGRAPAYASFVEKTKALYEYPESSIIQIVSILKTPDAPEWYQIKLPDGSLGWMEETQIVRIEKP